jgi:ketosteroid isomerase-like protein
MFSPTIENWGRPNVMNAESEKARILERDTEWSAIASEGRDIERIVSYWTDDAIVIPPGFAPVVGKEALREYVRRSLQIPGFRISWKSTDAQISPDGKMAYLLARNTVTMQGEGGKPITMAGRAVTIWRRDADGAWRCAVDIWNDEPPA